MIINCPKYVLAIDIDIIYDKDKQRFNKKL